MQAQAAEALSQVKGAATKEVPQPGQADAMQQPSKLDIAQGFAQLHMNTDGQVGHQVGCGQPVLAAMRLNLSRLGAA